MPQAQEEGEIMTAEKYLVCHKCQSVVYVCRNGKLDHNDNIAHFIEHHEHNCKGNIEVWDECCVPFYKYFSREKKA